jgi:hypothetical protein
MVLIPNDIGIRMRMQAEAQLLQPAAAVTEISGDLPELRKGQTFTARIVESLPENTFRALVAGKSLTLSLPEGAKTGDTLDLVVIDRTPKTVVAQLAGKSSEVADPAGSLYQYTTLSKTAQLITTLLPAEGETAAPTPLTRGEPVLAHAPTSAIELAKALGEAVKQSGVFYESHQAKWVTGQYPLAQLLEEPQAQHSDFSKLVTRLLSSNPADTTPELMLSGQESALAARHSIPSALTTNAETPLSNSPNTLEQAGQQTALKATGVIPEAKLSDVSVTKEAAAVPLGADKLAASATGIPDDIRPLVQQQLEAVGTQRLAWHGEVWPQQTMEWEIEGDAKRRDDSTQADEQWATSLKLTTPALGAIAARLQLGADGVRIVVSADEPMVAARLRAGIPALEQSMSAAGINLLGMLVWADGEHQSPSVAADSAEPLDG